MKTGNSGRTPSYEESLKIALAREYLTSNLSYKELGEKYGVSTGTANHFVRWYKRQYPNGVGPQSGDVDQGVEGNEKELLRQLREANLKIAGLEMLIVTAQKELGIDIVKKSGTKQSPK